MEIRHYRFDRITINPIKCFGKPCIRGLRMPVASILSYLSSEMTVEEILEQWPELEVEDIHQALGYASWAYAFGTPSQRTWLDESCVPGSRSRPR